MLARVLRGTGAARAAVAGLAVGLAALVGLSLWSNDRSLRTTAWVRSSDEVSAYWSRAFLSLHIEGETLADYVAPDSAAAPEPLESASGSAQPNLDWLVANGSAADRSAARSTQETYIWYTQQLRALIDADQGRHLDQTAIDAQTVNLTISTLQKQVIANMTRKRMETYAYLKAVDTYNTKLRLAEIALGVVDLLLLALSAVVLLGHQRRTERQAVRDALTGLANRVLLGRRLRRALRAADRSGRSVCLLMLDLNGFKQVNDTFGHHAGDLLLQLVAARLLEAIRSGDTAARLGGDEFAVVLPDITSVEEAQLIAERLLAALQMPAELDGNTVDVLVSIGAAVYPLHSGDADQLIHHADIAMYEAKRRRAGALLYNPAVTTGSGGRDPLADLRRALREQELVLHYQPKARTDSAQICGVEALVRWQHPVRGLLLPGEFLPLVEESDLIHPFTYYVLEAALRQHRAWRLDGRLLPIAVNITAHNLRDPDFPARLSALLAEYRTAPEQLTLEITETTAVTDSASTTAVLGRLRETGVRVSIDDFGVGFSSLAYLQDLPLDELKIDRRLIASAHGSAGNSAVVRAILELARALQLDVVAEGVEDEMTLQTLEALGCAVAQGYYLCRPMPAPALTAWLAEQAQTGGKPADPLPAGRYG